MRRIKYFKESRFIKKHDKNNIFIESIWSITEDEIFDSFIELHDGMDVSIGVKFYLKGNNFKYEYENKLAVEEKIEAYAAAGLTPCIQVLIQSNEEKKKDRRMHSYAMEAIHNIVDYSLFDLKRGDGYLNIYLKFDEDSYETKKLYHKRSARSFNTLLSDFISIGYNCDVSRVFIKDNKMNLMYRAGNGLPIYYFTLEKKYKIELEMFDELVEVKKSFEKLNNDLFNLENIYQVENSLDIETVTSPTPTMRGEISVRFIIYVYEE